VPNGKKVIEHVIPQLIVELRADSIRILDRSNSNGAQSDAAEPPADEQPPE
jgi:single-strand DNA-binding protein